MYRIFLTLLLAGAGFAAAQPGAPLILGPGTQAIEIPHLAERLKPDGSAHVSAAIAGPSRPYVFWLRVDVNNVGDRTLRAVIAAPRTNTLDFDVLRVLQGTPFERARQDIVARPNLATFAVADSI